MVGKTGYVCPPWTLHCIHIYRNTQLHRSLENLTKLKVKLILKVGSALHRKQSKFLENGLVIMRGHIQISNKHVKVSIASCGYSLFHIFFIT